MDDREVRLECLKLARGPDVNQTLATAKAYEEYVAGEVKRGPGRPRKVEKPDPFAE